MALYKLLAAEDDLPPSVKSVLAAARSTLHLPPVTRHDDEAAFNQQMVKLSLADSRSDAVQVCMDRVKEGESG